MSRLPRSDVIFALVMVSLVGLCAIYDANHVLTVISSMVPFRRKLNSTPQTTPPPVHISLPVKPSRRKTSVAICALSKSKPGWQYIHDSSVYKLFLVGIYRTTKKDLDEYSIQVHIGVDTTDPFWSKYDNYHALILASARDFNLRVAVHHYPKKHRDHLPMNELMRDAARTGAEYLVRLNDDSEITSMGWLPLAVHQLLAYNPPNVGVVGPVCREGKTSILTHDMVHRTHLDIFQTYYPPQFHNWYVDDWISEVYGRDRTTKIPGWTVHHHVGPPRYNPIMVDNRTLQQTIKEGRERIMAYLSRWNVSRKLTQAKHTDQFQAIQRGLTNPIKSAAIFIFADTNSAKKYAQNINSFRCYVSRHADYELVVMSEDDTEFSDGCIKKDFKFVRHCMLSNYMLKHPGIRLFFHLDADHAIMDISRRIETFVSGEKDLTFEIRFHIGEITVGSYIAQNTEFSRSFLRELSHTESMVDDNEALQTLILKRVELKNSCPSTSDYFKFVRCFHETIRQSGCQHDFWTRHADVLTPPHSFTYDGWLTKYQYSPKTFIHHAMKNPPIGGNNNGRIFPDVLKNGCKMHDDDPYRISPEQEDRLLQQRIDSIQSIWNANGLYNTSCILFKDFPTSPATASRSTPV